MHNNTLKPVVMIASAIYRFLNNTHVCDDNSIVSTDFLCDSVSFFIEKTNLVRTRQCLVYTFSTIRERISTRAITTCRWYSGWGWIEPLMTKLTQKFQSAFYLYCNLSTDEMVIVWKGSWKHKQYNALKPKKHHKKPLGFVIQQQALC